MPSPARRPLVAQQFRSRALSVLPPEKPESFAFWPPEAFFAAPRRSPGCGIRGRQESPAKLAEALAWLADLGSVAADRICLMPQEWNPAVVAAFGLGDAGMTAAQIRARFGG